MQTWLNFTPPWPVLFFLNIPGIFHWIFHIPKFSIFSLFCYFFGIFHGIFHIPKFSILWLFCYFFGIFQINIPKRILIYNGKSNFRIFLEYSIFHKSRYFTCFSFFVEYSISDIFIFHGIFLGIFHFKNRVCFAGA